MCSTATSSAQAINVFAADELYYDLNANYAVAIFTLIGSQLLGAFTLSFCSRRARLTLRPAGYGLAGLCRAVVVFPTYCVYPSLIPVVQLFDLVHRDKDYSAQRRRLKFFLVVFVAIFVWEWVPEVCPAPSLLVPSRGGGPQADAAPRTVHRAEPHGHLDLLSRSPKLALGDAHLRRSVHLLLPPEPRRGAER